MEKEPHNMVQTSNAACYPGLLDREKGHISGPAAFSEGRRGIGLVQIGCYRKNQGNQIFFLKTIPAENLVIESPKLNSHILSLIFALNRAAHRYEPFFRH
jgi:hypothetical protein